jgi:hypothetical protein
MIPTRKLRGKGKNAMVRINTRITPAQHEFIKIEAKKRSLSEGEMTRLMLDSYMLKN